MTPECATVMESLVPDAQKRRIVLDELRRSAVTAGFDGGDVYLYRKVRFNTSQRCKHQRLDLLSGRRQWTRSVRQIDAHRQNPWLRTAVDGTGSCTG